jgi:hypothetical protein
MTNYSEQCTNIFSAFFAEQKTALSGGPAAEDGGRSAPLQSLAPQGEILAFFSVKLRDLCGFIFFQVFHR